MLIANGGGTVVTHRADTGCAVGKFVVICIFKILWRPTNTAHEEPESYTG